MALVFNVYGCPEIALVHDRDRQASEGCVPGGASSVNTGADDEKIEPRVGESRNVSSHGRRR